MKYHRLYLAAALGVFLLIGCGTVGKDFPSSKVSHIKEKVTTKSQVLEMFGLPYKEGTQDGYTTWTYQKDTWSAFGKDSSRDLVIMFDKDGVVNAYRYTSSTP